MGEIDMVNAFIEEGREFIFRGKKLVIIKETTPSLTRGFMRFKYIGTNTITLCGVHWFCENLGKEIKYA